ncbi:MAG: hypothetical protein GY797_31545 [Deltaproteobacteria bacterium]|nr:hypothetical protein [Deltaproteobacteria bacterium]MCP4984765.1 hypothetical protein [Colwellia sp.]
MSTVTPDKLLSMWAKEQLTLEMATGHILQNLAKMQTAIDALNITLYNLRADVDSLIAHTGMTPNLKGKKKPPKKD